MPLYDYLCLSCNKTFDRLVKAWDTPVECECGSSETERQASTAAVNTEGCPGYEIKWQKKKKEYAKAMAKDIGFYNKR